MKSVIITGLFAVVIALDAALAITTSQAAAASAPYRTDAQAEHYLSTGLKTWAGIKLSTAQFRTVFCLNGYYSKTEKRTGHHYPQGKVNAVGENVFRSFMCTLSVDSRSFNLYVVTTPTGWSVKVDR